MTNKKQFSIIILLSIISLLFAGISLAADWSFAYSQAPSNFVCSSTRVYSTDGVISYSLPKGTIVITTEALNGSTYASSKTTFSGTGTHSFPVVSTRFPSATAFPYTYTINYTVNVDSQTISTSSLSVRCIDANTAVVIANSLNFAGSSSDSEVAGPPDARFNWGTGDSNIAIIYPEGDSIGLYLFAGEQYIPNFVSAADFGDYLENPPSENTLIAQAGAVSVYVLTTGEIQFNIGPDAEGKQYVLIMSDLSGSNSYGYAL